MSEYKNPFEPGGKFYNRRITDASRVTEPRIMPRWVEKEEKEKEKESGNIGTKFYDIDTGEFIEQIDDGTDRVVGINEEEYTKLKEEFNKPSFFNIKTYPNKLIENKYLTNYILSNSKSGGSLNLTYKEFNELAGTLYAEMTAKEGTWEEAAAIYSVLENRKKAYLNTYDVNYSIFKVIKIGACGWSERSKINSKTASNLVKRNAQKGLMLAIINNDDYSNGAYYWHGTDFNRPPSHNAHRAYYLTGFKFTNPSHDIWNLGDKIKHGKNTVYINNKAVVKEWDYKYESTAAFEKTTFMRLTQEYKDAQFNDEYENHNPF